MLEIHMCLDVFVFAQPARLTNPISSQLGCLTTSGCMALDLTVQLGPPPKLGMLLIRFPPW